MLKLTSGLAKPAQQRYKVMFQVTHAITRLQNSRRSFHRDTNEPHKAIRAAITPTLLWEQEQKAAAFSVDVSRTLCKQAPVSTCNGAV